MRPNCFFVCSAIALRSACFVVGRDHDALRPSACGVGGYFLGVRFVQFGHDDVRAHTRQLERGCAADPVQRR